MYRPFLFIDPKENNQYSPFSFPSLTSRLTSCRIINKAYKRKSCDQCVVKRRNERWESKQRGMTQRNIHGRILFWNFAANDNKSIVFSYCFRTGKSVCTILYKLISRFCESGNNCFLPSRVFTSLSRPATSRSFIRESVSNAPRFRLLLFIGSYLPRCELVKIISKHRHRLIPIGR